jgi:hypothetical protein
MTASLGRTAPPPWRDGRELDAEPEGHPGRSVAERTRGGADGTVGHQAENAARSQSGATLSSRMRSPSAWVEVEGPPARGENPRTRPSQASAFIGVAFRTTRKSELRGSPVQGIGLIGSPTRDDDFGRATGAGSLSDQPAPSHQVSQRGEAERKLSVYVPRHVNRGSSPDTRS